MSHSSRQFFVKSDNLLINNTRIGTRVLFANTGMELLEKVCREYELPWPIIPAHPIQLWSGPIGVTTRTRIDNLETIPQHVTDVWIWAVGAVGR